MRDGLVPSAMVFASLGLMLAFVPRKNAARNMILAIVLAFAASRLRLGETANNVAIMSCWLAISVLAFRTYRPSRAESSSIVALSALAGIVAGVASSATALPGALWQPALAVLVIVPATLAVERGYTVAPRVVISWLVAVAVLAALLPYVVKHPGYIPDHRD